MASAKKTECRARIANLNTGSGTMPNKLELRESIWRFPFARTIACTVTKVLLHTVVLGESLPDLACNLKAQIKK